MEGKKKLQILPCAIKRNVVMSPLFALRDRLILVIILVYSQYDTSRLVSNTLTKVDLLMNEREPIESELVV